MIDINELNLYKESAKDKIVDYDKQITKLKRKIEDLENKNEHSLLYNISSTVKKQREKRLEKYNKKLNILELKSETYKFDNIKQPEKEPSTDTISYFQYQNKLIDNNIKKIQIKKDSSVLTVSKYVYSKSIKKLKRQQYKNNLKIKAMQREEEDIQSKKIDEHIAAQKFKESKQANEKFKENKSKITAYDEIKKSNTSDKSIKSNDESNPNEQKESDESSKPENEFSKQSDESSLNEQKESNKSSAPNKSSKPENSSTQSLSNIDTVSNIDYSTLNPKNLRELSKLISINTKIYNTLKKISDNQINEQNISIKDSKIERDEPILVSQKDEKPVKEKGSLLSKLIGFASLLFSIGITSPKMLFKYMLKSVKSSLKLFLKPFLDPINFAIKGLYKLVKPLIKLADKLSKTILGTSEKIGTEDLAKTSEKIGTEDLVKTSEKIGTENLVKTSEKIGTENLVKTSEKIGAESASKFASAAKSVKSSGIFGWLEKKASGIVSFAKKKGLGLAEKLVLPYIEKLIGKKGLKILLKVLTDLPGISILTGLGFATYDIVKGNYAHAALDVLSGIVGSIPWVGPILGIATDYAGNLIIDKYSKSKVHSKTNIKVKTSNKLSEDRKSSKNNSYVFNSMVEEEIANLKQDPPFLPKEIKYYNNKNNENIPVITINKESYTNETGQQIKVDNIYKLRKLYAEYLVASSQNVDSKQYKKQILSFINSKLYTGNIKTSSNNQLNTKYISTSKIYNTSANTEVPDIIFTKDQVKIGTNIYPSNQIIEQDYNNYKLNKNSENTEKILEDIKVLKNSVYKKDNSESKIKTLSSIFNNNQSVLNRANPSMRHTQNNQLNRQEPDNSNNINHINIIRPSQKESARLMNMYQ